MDLHCHSTASDGTRSPAEVATLAAARGLEVLSLTDHDTLAGVAEAKEAAPASLRIVPGVEISTQHNGRGVHLLAWFRDDRADDPGLHRHLAERVDGRRRRFDRITERLAAAGAPIDAQAVLDEADGQSITRAHVARALLRAGHIGAFQEAFDRFIGPGKPAFVPNDPWATADAVRFVAAHGGISSIAHPGIDGITRPEVEELARAGLSGVEAHHPRHVRQTRRRFRKMARELGLLVTGGSDWHGHPTATLLGPTVGDGLPLDVRAPFLAALDA